MFNKQRDIRRWSRLYELAILLLLCLGGYMHALNGEFVFDDTVAIVKNPVVNQLPINYTTLFNSDFWGESLLTKASHKSYRPLITFMFHMERAHWGLQARHMKAINLALHCLNTILMWCTLHSFAERQKVNGILHAATLVASALFAVHPIHTEAVCGIVGRADLLFGSLYILALLLWNYSTGWLACIGVITLTALGLLIKETAIMIPVSCLFTGHITNGFWQRSLREQFYSMCSWRYAFITFATGGLIVLRLWLQNFESPDFKRMDNPVAFHDDALTSFLSQHYLYVLNLWLLLCPQWLSFDWALGCVRLISSWADLRLQCVLAFYALLIKVITSNNRQAMYGHILGIGLLIIPFLPASGLINVGFVIAERVLYVPSIGFCILIGCAFAQLHNRYSERIIVIGLRCGLMMVIAVFLLRTRQRSLEWLNEERLFHSALQVCPNNAKVHYNIARLAMEHGRKDEEEQAFRHYHKAIELYPEYEAALMNLGNLYREVGDLENAEIYLRKALDAMPDFAAAWMNLGIVQAAKKRFDDAHSSYENALRFRKNYAMCYYNLGNLYLEERLYTDAMESWQKSLSLNSRHSRTWSNILTMLDSRGLANDVIRLSADALERLPNDTVIMFIRANALGKLERFVEAEHLYKEVIAFDATNYIYQTNLGVLYHRWNKPVAAIECYKRAIGLNRVKAHTARTNLEKLTKRLILETVNGTEKD